MSALAQNTEHPSYQDILMGGWTELHRHVAQNWTKIPAESVSQIAGCHEALTRSITATYSLRVDQAHALIDDMLAEFDQISRLRHYGDILIKIENYWPRLNSADISSINGRKSNLVSILAHRYDMDRASAWKQVNLFFRHFN